MTMRYIKCQVCNSAKHRTLFRTRDYDSGGKTVFNVVKCDKCGFIYLNPQPDDKMLSKFYVFDYYGNQSFFHKIFVFINQFIIKNKADLILKKKKGKILDVGCGDGDFLKFMKDHGWGTYGIEPSSSGAKLAKGKLNGKIYNTVLEKAKFPNNFFDAVTIWHVLEHVDNPGKMIKEVERIMKRNGLLIIAVPNIGSIQAKIGGKKWFHLDVPRHLHHFSTKTLKALMKSNGFKVDKVQHFSFVYNLIGVLQTLLNMTGIKFNFLHHLIKRVGRERSYINFSFIFHFVLTIFFGILFFVPSVILSLAESFFNRGATITVYSRKI